MLERTSLHTGLLSTGISYQPTLLILVHCVISGKLSPGSISQNFLLLISLQFVLVISVTPCEFRRDLWRQKTSVHGLSYSVICVILGLAILVQYRRMTDGQTDRRSDGHTTTAYVALA